MRVKNGTRKSWFQVLKFRRLAISSGIHACMYKRTYQVKPRKHIWMCLFLNLFQFIQGFMMFEAPCWPSRYKNELPNKKYSTKNQTTTGYRRDFIAKDLVPAPATALLTLPNNPGSAFFHWISNTRQSISTCFIQPSNNHMHTLCSQIGSEPNEKKNNRRKTKEMSTF